MSFEWKNRNPGSRPGHEQVQTKHLDWSLSCPREQTASMTRLDALPHISTMIEPPHEWQAERNFRYPLDWKTQWWKRPKIFDLATDNLSPYEIYETIVHYKIIDPDWAFEPVVRNWSRIGRLTDVAQLSPQDKLDLCEQELQFSAMIFGREEAKQYDRLEADRQFLKRHLENCQDLYSIMLVEYKKTQDYYARVEADDITEFWQHLGKNKPETSFEVMNAFRLDLGRFTFWKQVISRSTVPADVMMKINTRFDHLMQIGKSFQGREKTVCRFMPILPARNRSLSDLTILRHWSYRKKLRQRLSPFTSRNRFLD